MTPEVEQILQDIGWNVVKRASPIFAHHLAGVFASNGESHLAETDAEARKIADKLGTLGQHLVEAIKLLGSLQKGVRRNISSASLGYCEIMSVVNGEVEIPDLPSEVEKSLLKLLVGLEATQARHEYIGGSARRGSPKNLRAHAVAYSAAQIYFIGLGSMPEAYNETAGQRIRGRYGEALERLFGAMGYGYDAIGPARLAISRLRNLGDEQLKLYLLLRCPLTRDLVVPALQLVF